MTNLEKLLPGCGLSLVTNPRKRTRFRTMPASDQNTRRLQDCHGLPRTVELFRKEILTPP